jgi:hypothetical protein
MVLTSHLAIDKVCTQNSVELKGYRPEVYEQIAIKSIPVVVVPIIAVIIIINIAM